jgi:RNA polymerase sigma-70 factor, ECF subfamily
MRLLSLLPFGLAFGILQVALKGAQDEDLMLRLKAREHRAMADLYDRYGRIVYSLILRMVRNPAITEDLVQETMVRIWNRTDSFDAQSGALGPWVLTVARNRAVEYLRHLGGQAHAGSMALEKLERPELFSSVDSDSFSIEHMRRVKQALEKLSPDQKTAIELTYYEGLTETETAERLGQPLEKIKISTREAIRILRDEQVAKA